jgi:hypothetical protein
MKNFWQRVRVALTNSINQPLSFKRACTLSICTHLLFLVTLGAVIHLLEIANIYAPPLIFDFVFAPAQEYDHTSPHPDDTEQTSQPAKVEDRKPAAEAQSVKTVEAKTSSKFSDESSPLHHKADIPAIETELPIGSHPSKPSDSNEEQASDENISEPEYVANEKKSSREANPFLIHTPDPDLLSVLPKRVDKPTDHSAKLAISTSEKKMLNKKLKKWTESLSKEWNDGQIEWKHAGKIYSARLSHLPAKSETDIDEIHIAVSTEENGLAVSTEMRLKRLAFSNFAQFVDYWDTGVAVHNDILDGRFHANTTINVSTSRGVQPKFQGKVTTASYDVKLAGTFPLMDQKSIFVGGLETGVKEIRLPKTNLPFASDSTVSANRVHHFSEEAWINFHADGSYGWRTQSSQHREERRPLPQESSFYIVGDKQSKLHLRGVLRGKVLVYSAGSIIIDNDVTYARHPELAFDAEDFLGIVSDRDVEIGHPSVSGPGDLYVFASIYAKGRFRVRQLNGSGEATLYVYGSLTAGSLSATEPRYATHVIFDKRLETRRPPNFPMSERYELKEWDGQWKVKPQSNDAE